MRRGEMLQAEEACGGSGGSAAAEGCAMVGRVEGVPGSTVPANSTGMTKFGSRHRLSDGGLHRFVGNFARQSPSSWPTG